jgi:hypothetical protein
MNNEMRARKGKNPFGIDMLEAGVEVQSSVFCLEGNPHTICTHITHIILAPKRERK